jgi:cell division septation protein DedD
MAAQVSLSLENLVILTIVAIMLVIFSFSLGIERGKRVALASPATAGDGVTAGATAAAVPASTGKMDRASEKPEAKDKVVVKAAPVVNAAPVLVKASEAKASTSGAYTLQVASYKAEKFAQREADKLKQKGFNDVFVLAKGAYTIVCVGNFQKKEDASSIKRQLKSRYQDFVVRRL